MATRGIGHFEYKKGAKKPEDHLITAWPEVKRVETGSIDFIIMGSDGIWQIKKNQWIIDWIATRIDK